jgi:hypothetical protein
MIRTRPGGPEHRAGLRLDEPSGVQKFTYGTPDWSRVMEALASIKPSVVGDPAIMRS